MPGEGPVLHGLEPITGQLIEQLVQRPDGRSRLLPVVVAVGPPGSGKTVLLHSLAQRCAKLPLAHVDLGRGERTPREIFGELAFELGRKRAQFGSITFPQLWLCVVAVGSTLHLQADNRRAALQSLRQVVSSAQPMEARSQSVADILEAAGQVPEGLSPWVGMAVESLLQSLNRLSIRRRIKRGPRLTGEEVERDDMLIDLAKWAHGDDESRAEADAIFGMAFLHDLRHAYSGMRGTGRTLNSVLLLDNVHSPSGRHFLQTLREARRRNGAEPDPLVVVATSAQWLPAWSECWHRPGMHRFSDITERREPEHRTGGLEWPEPRTPPDIFTDWASADNPAASWFPWYLVDLSRLSAQTTGDLAADQRMRSVPRVADFVRALTGGNAAATTDVLAALEQTGEDDPLACARTVLTSAVGTHHDPLQEPVDAPGTVLERARERLLGDFAAAENLRDLVTAAAGRTVDVLYQREILDSALPDGEALLQELRNRLWIRTGGGPEPEMVLDTWLRRILLCELADREPDDPRSWEGTHTICRDVYRRKFEEGEAAAEIAAIYHDLALGELGAAIEYLERPFLPGHTEFGHTAATDWLSDLDLITSAPRRPDAEGTPFTQVETIVRDNGLEPEHEMAWLIAALWVSNDPLGDPQRILDRTIENEFRQLARGLGRGALLLYERAERYR
ncbi:hypothetical protein [Nocardia carnea]|uniref:hypothetical protein n=1 Tax=Nocardia carnea TaxID=37328 RepID=UPI002456EC28|nr:hypothetical protein [Nocardia carnea]